MARAPVPFSDEEQHASIERQRQGQIGAAIVGIHEGRQSPVLVKQNDCA